MSGKMKIRGEVEVKINALLQELTLREVTRKEIQKNYKMNNSQYEWVIKKMTYAYPIYEYNNGKDVYIGLLKI